jgi:hypothetical protein
MSHGAFATVRFRARGPHIALTVLHAHTAMWAPKCRPVPSARDPTHPHRAAHYAGGPDRHGARAQ